MEAGKVKVSEEFQTPNSHIWIGVDVSLNEGDDPDKAFEYALQKVRQWARVAESNPYMPSAEPVLPEIDYRFDNAKDMIKHIEYREEALQFLASTQYEHNLELKNIANSKPSKHE